MSTWIPDTKPRPPKKSYKKQLECLQYTLPLSWYIGCQSYLRIRGPGIDHRHRQSVTTLPRCSCFLFGLAHQRVTRKPVKGKLGCCNEFECHGSGFWPITGSRAQVMEMNVKATSSLAYSPNLTFTYQGWRESGAERSTVQWITLRPVHSSVDIELYWFIQKNSFPHS